MQATRSIPVPAKTRRASELGLLVPVALVAAAAAWWSASPIAVEATAASQPVLPAWPAPSAYISVPDAAQVHFKDDAFEEPAPTF